MSLTPGSAKSLRAGPPSSASARCSISRRESSPGSSIARTSDRDLLAQAAQLEYLPDVVQLVRDLAIGVRYRDRVTLSMRHDFPEAWHSFIEKGVPLLFESTLPQFCGLRPGGRPLRHSIKIKSLRFTAKFRPQILEEPKLPDEKLPEDSLDPRDLSPKTKQKKPESFRLAAPGAVGRLRNFENSYRAASEARLMQDYPERFKWAVFHAGEGWQIDENGALRWIEWGPQLADSNHDAEETESYYNALEGLTPAARWLIDYDRSTGLRPEDFEDMFVIVEVTYGRIEENLRLAFHMGQHEELGQAPAPEINRDPARPDGPYDARQDAVAARAFAARRVATVQQKT